MKKFLIFYSRQICLLFLTFTFFSCHSKADKDKNQTPQLHANENVIETDSIEIVINFKSKGITGFNIKNKYHQYYFLEFKNNASKDTTIVKKIPRVFKNQLIDISGFVNKGGLPTFYENYFLIDSTSHKIAFNFSNDNLKLLEKKSTINVDSIHSLYNKLGLKIKNHNKKNEGEKRNLYQQLENLYKATPQKINKLEKELIDTYYIYTLQMIYPLDKRIDTFVENVSTPMACNPFSSILFNYIKDRINSFDYNKWNTKNYSKEYIHLMSVGIFNFLRFEDNKGNQDYEPAKNWLKTTDLYKNNAVYIDKETSILDNKIFKNKLEKLVFISNKNTSFSISQIVKNNPSNYFLLDFWASWCAPCIEEINIMKQMQLPNNVKVISISVDAEKDHQKWVKMTQKLEQPLSFRLDDKSPQTNNFITYLELQSIPRYIIIDENFNLIDQAFIHPSHSEFLTKLKSLKNH